MNTRDELEILHEAGELWRNGVPPYICPAVSSACTARGYEYQGPEVDALRKEVCERLAIALGDTAMMTITVRRFEPYGGWKAVANSLRHDVLLDMTVFRVMKLMTE